MRIDRYTEATELMEPGPCFSLCRLRSVVSLGSWRGEWFGPCLDTGSESVIAKGSDSNDGIQI